MHLSHSTGAARQTAGAERACSSGYSISTSNTACAQCGGKLKIIAAIEEPAVIVRIFTHQGLPARAPPGAPARRLPLFETA